jgi:hypothetical protein
VPDPHLHAHCFAFNVTFDENENRWKAAQFGDIKRDGPYFEAKFHSRMAGRMAMLGLPVERTRNGWEIAGFSKATLDKFSRRTAHIEEMAKEKGITSDADKDGLGARTREKKQKNLSTRELRREWRSRLDRDEQSALSMVAKRVGSMPIPENTRDLDETSALAVDHCFERKSVVPERVLLAEAIKRSVGQVSASKAEESVLRQNLLHAERDGRRFVTTPGVLDEEKRMLEFARQGRGAFQPLGGGDHDFNREQLNEGQRRAVLHVLNSADRVILIRGAAGTGKTTMMQEAVEAIQKNGTNVFTFAPSAAASRGVLASEGFTTADTVARLLKDEKLQQQVKDSIIWVDEAGLLGVKATAQLFDLAERMNARVILSGDRYQHSSVERGAALRLLETEAGLIPAEIRDIQRQKGQYKQAVAALSEGRTADGFKQLDRLGWIREVADASRYKTMASEYVSAVSEGKSALVVSPTHAEGEKITQAIREELKQLGFIQSDERRFRVLHNTRLTQAERADAANYLPDDVIVFQQNAKGFKKGQRVIVGDSPLPLDQAERFQTYHVGTLDIAPGDVLRVTQNGMSKDGKHRLNNGAIITVKDFDASGDIVLTNGWTVARDYGHLASGFCVTSHASQGSTVDRVFIAQASDSFAASSQEQFYVSVSRARQQATVFTDDKAALLEAVNHSDERLSATELINDRNRRDRVVAMQRMEHLTDMKPDPRQLDRSREGLSHER